MQKHAALSPMSHKQSTHCHVFLFAKEAHANVIPQVR